MPPKMKLPIRSLRRSQRIKPPKKHTGPIPTIDLDPIEDVAEPQPPMLPAPSPVPSPPPSPPPSPAPSPGSSPAPSSASSPAPSSASSPIAEGRYGVEENQAEDFEDELPSDGAGEDELPSDDDSGDDIWDDDQIPDHISSDEESELESIPRARQAENPEDYLSLGKTFNCPEDFKLAVLRYSLKTRYDVMLHRSQSRKIGAKCSNSEVDCPWRVYCSYDKKKRKMQIKVYVSEHSCVRSGYSKMLKQPTIAKLFDERLRKNPKITPDEMVDEIKREYNLVVGRGQCAKAKTRVLKARKVAHELHFARIWDYQAEVFRSNPGSTFDIERIPGPTVGSLPRFFRLFVCFKAQRDTWKNTCRPILGIDGAFLKWDIKGHLLAATGRDGDNRIVPVAWAIVEIENDDNWDWFMRKLAGSLDLQDGRRFTVISDKQAVTVIIF